MSRNDTIKQHSALTKTGGNEDGRIIVPNNNPPYTESAGKGQDTQSTTHALTSSSSQSRANGQYDGDVHNQQGGKKIRGKKNMKKSKNMKSKKCKGGTKNNKKYTQKRRVKKEHKKQIKKTRKTKTK
jgi:hypothetical protein